ncbi:MAG: hypothetical protein M3161_04860, partial [Actinomycetota bacterium]|nr:hypothetical protein [Actinomycetota bacterium]
YAAGFTFSSDFPTSDGAYRTSDQGRGQDAWVAKFTPEGSVAYSTLVGGTAGPLDGGRALAVDDAGRAYLTGTMGSDDMETRRAFQPEANGVQDAYLAVLNEDGSDLYFATYLGGRNVVDPHEVRQGRVGIIEDGQSLTLGPDGLVYLAGVTDADDFPTTPDAFMPANPGGRSFFLSVIDVHEGKLVYSTYLGGRGEDGALSFQAAAVAVDDHGFVYFAGTTRMTEEQARTFPIKDAFDPTYNGGWDVFVMKFAPTWGEPIYSTFLGSRQDDFVNSIAVGRSGAPHVVGKTLEAPITAGLVPTESFLEARAGDPIVPRGGGADGFLVKLAPCGDRVDMWSFIGGSSPLDRTPAQGTLASEETAIVVTLDRWESAYVTGLMTTRDFRPAPTKGEALSGPWDAFVVKFVDDPGSSGRNAFDGPASPEKSLGCGSPAAEHRTTPTK